METNNETSTAKEWFVPLVYDLVSNSLKSYHQHKDRYKEMGVPPLQVRCVNVGTFRQAGHSTAAVNLYKQFSPSFIVVKNYMHKEWLIHHFDIDPNDVVLADIQAFHNWIAKRNNKTYQLMIVDTASLISKQVREELFIIAEHAVDLFVELQ